MTLDTGVDAGVFHVVNLQPFHMWDSSSPHKCAVSTTVARQGAEALVIDAPITDSHADLPTKDLFCDTPGDTDSTSAMDSDSDGHSMVSEPDPNTDQAGHYDLRPRRCPRITSGWSGSRWTNTYHTDRLDLK